VKKDLIVIGGGPAGQAAAFAAREAGAQAVLLVEQEALGGTCTNRGCIPTKFLLSRAAALEAAGSPAARSAWSALSAHKGALVRGLARSIESRCAAAAVDLARGRGRLLSPETVEVVASDGTAARHEAKRIVIAAGSAPAALPGAVPDGVNVLSSTDALDLAELPSSVVVIGSGAVGAEFAFLFNRFGVAVTLVEAAGRLFPQEDEAVDQHFREVYARLGIPIRVGDPVERVVPHANAVDVHLRSGDVLRADKAILGVGRRLLSEDLGCLEAGIALGARGEVHVDDRQRTSQPSVYAAGDVTGRMLLAHVADREGRHAGLGAAGSDPGPIRYESIPWVTFTSPEIGSVGLTAEAASRRGVDTVTAVVATMTSIKARIDRRTEGFIKAVARRDTGEIVGATVLGHGAADLVHILALAIHNRMTAGDVRGAVFAHPTKAELISDIADELRNALLSAR
jgi:dihydrolipoamide dehydrogenase